MISPGYVVIKMQFLSTFNCNSPIWGDKVSMLSLVQVRL